VARSHISWTELGVCSCGAWITITIEPTMQDTHPNTPILGSRSFNKKWDKTALPTDTSYVSSTIQTQNPPQLSKFNLKLRVPNYNTKCTKRSNQNSRSIDISHKICNFPNNHCKHIVQDPSKFHFKTQHNPSKEEIKLSLLLVTMPAHQSGSSR